MGARRADLKLCDITIPPGRLRSIRWWWVDALAEMISQSGKTEAIEVVEAGTGYSLVAGRHRFEAAKKLERETIPAEIWPEGEADVRLREVFENLGRLELTALDRCTHIAEWKAIYEALHGRRARGRPKKSGNLAAFSDDGELPRRFTDEAQEKLGLSDRGIRRSVIIAEGVQGAIRSRLADTKLADNQRELELLAQQPVDRQAAILDLVLADPADAASVAEAIAILDGRPLSGSEAKWQRLAGTFGRLAKKEQFSFFDAHAELVDAWLAARGGRRQGAAA